MTCFKCGTGIELESRPGRQDACASCGAYLHCCRNCRFHDEVAHHQCREPQADFVQDKEMGNFCAYFEVGASGAEAESRRREEARRKLEGLFKDKE